MVRRGCPRAVWIMANVRGVTPAFEIGSYQPCSRTMGSKSAAGGNPGAASVEARVTRWPRQGTNKEGATRRSPQNPLPAVQRAEVPRFA